MRGDDERRGSQRDKILSFLEARGSEGASNVELAEVGGLRYGGRVYELRHRFGYVITVQPGEDDGIFIYTLQMSAAKPEPRSPAPRPAHKARRKAQMVLPLFAGMGR